jgi:carboxyl-terminal processing protease
VRRLIEEFEAEGGIDGLVLDLRENGGGHLTEAIDLVNLFVPKGPVVQLRETGGRVEVLESEQPAPAYSGPLTLLVDRFSASASEIFAAAMQDYGRGVVIGQETYGKGTVQNLYPLDRYAIGQDPGYGQLTVTIGMYYRVTGDSTQNRGVQPDIRLPSAISPEEVGESSRDAALPWNRIRPARYSPSTSLGPLVADLQQRHEQRVATDAEYQEALKDIGTIEAMRSQKSISLNLEKRRAERAALSAGDRAHPTGQRAAAGDDEPADDLDALDELPDALLNEAAQITADLTQIEPQYVARARASN